MLANPFCGLVNLSKKSFLTTGLIIPIFPGKNLWFFARPVRQQLCRSVVCCRCGNRGSPRDIHGPCIPYCALSMPFHRLAFLHSLLYPDRQDESTKEPGFLVHP